MNITSLDDIPTLDRNRVERCILTHNAVHQEMQEEIYSTGISRLKGRTGWSTFSSDHGDCVQVRQHAYDFDTDGEEAAAYDVSFESCGDNPGDPIVVHKKFQVELATAQGLARVVTLAQLRGPTDKVKEAHFRRAKLAMVGRWIGKYEEQVLQHQYGRAPLSDLDILYRDKRARCDLYFTDRTTDQDIAAGLRTYNVRVNPLFSPSLSQTDWMITIRKAWQAGEQATFVVGS